ncbi:MAG: VanZ family protein [Clostridia bacterium]|nr:VanZ family protein [Clostridia bacterium]
MSKKKIIIIRIIIIFLILAWMNLVFGFSAQDSNESSSLSQMIASWFSDDILIQQRLEPIIRKIAHFSEYGLGGALFFSLFSTFNIKERKRMMFAGLLGFTYAVTDEIHQLFVPGRTGKIVDVYIDSLGVITGVLCMKLCIMVFIQLRKKKQTQI